MSHPGKIAMQNRQAGLATLSPWERRLTDFNRRQALAIRDRNVLPVPDVDQIHQQQQQQQQQQYQQQQHQQQQPQQQSSSWGMGFFKSDSLPQPPLPTLAVHLYQPADKVYKPDEVVAGHVALTPVVPIAPVAVEASLWGHSQIWWV